MGVEPKTGVKIAEMNIPGPEDFLSAEEVAKLTPETVIERVRALKPLIAKHRTEAERRRMPVPEVWNALRRTGYFYLVVPKVWGGLEATFDQMLDATFAICEADPSMGWLCSFSVTNPRSAAAFSDEALKEMYGDGKTFGHGKFTTLNTLFAPFGQARRVEGGWRVSGTWFWGTTVQQADWVSVMCFYDGAENKAIAFEDGAQGLGTFLFPASEAVVLDTWTADGLIATGTHKVMAKDVFVPDYRTVTTTMMTQDWIENIRSRWDYPIFRADLRNALSTTIAVAVIGVAKGALARYTEILKEWTKRGDEGREADKQVSQIRLAHVHAKISACEIQLRDVARRTYAIVDEPSAVQVAFGEKAMAEICYISHEAREAVLEISKGLGTSAHYLEEPMSQYVRDVNVGSSHRAVNWDTNMTIAGRALLGLPPAPPPKNPRMA